MSLFISLKKSTAQKEQKSREKADRLWVPPDQKKTARIFLPLSLIMQAKANRRVRKLVREERKCGERIESERKILLFSLFAGFYMRLCVSSYNE